MVYQRPYVCFEHAPAVYHAHIGPHIRLRRIKNYLLIPPTVNIDVRRPREEPYHDIPEHQRDRLSRYGGGGGERVRPYVPFDIGTLH